MATITAWITGWLAGISMTFFVIRGHTDLGVMTTIIALLILVLLNMDTTESEFCQSETETNFSESAKNVSEKPLHPI